MYPMITCDLLANHGKSSHLNPLECWSSVIRGEIRSERDRPPGSCAHEESGGREDFPSLSSFPSPDPLPALQWVLWREMGEWGRLFRLRDPLLTAPLQTMAAIRRDARSTFSCRWHIKLIVSYLLMFFVTLIRAGHHGHSQGGLDKLLAAGLIAKALAKGGEEGGGGGGHHYMPIPIPLHAGGGGGGGHHHHVHHKYVPIPVKHHTNFIIAHHRVPVPVHVPVPVVKTKLVHVPVERTKIVPIIVHKGKNTHPHSHSSQYPYNSPSSSTIHIKKGRIQHGPSASPSSGIAALATSPRDTRHLRITTLGMVRKVKDNSRNGTTAAIQFHRPSSRAPDKWIVVVKDKKRQPIRRLASDIITADSKIITRTAIANSTAVSPAGPR